MDVFVYAIFVLAGLLLILFRKPFARFAIGAQNRTWGFHMGGKAVRITEALVPVIGGLWIVMSLTLLAVS